MNRRRERLRTTSGLDHALGFHVTMAFQVADKFAGLILAIFRSSAVVAISALSMDDHTDRWNNFTGKRKQLSMSLENYFTRQCGNSRL